jgi:hypothetical protein
LAAFSPALGVTGVSMTVSGRHESTDSPAETPDRNGGGTVVRHFGTAKEITGLGISPFQQGHAMADWSTDFAARIRTRREATYEPPN